MSKKPKETVTETPVTEASAMETPVTEALATDGTVPETPPAEPTEPKEATAPNEAQKAIVADLNAWEPSPVSNGKPKEVVKHPNGITAYHY